MQYKVIKEFRLSLEKRTAKVGEILTNINPISAKDLILAKKIELYNPIKEVVETLTKTVKEVTKDVEEVKKDSLTARAKAAKFKTKKE